MPDQYIFVANGDACDQCSALDGTITAGPMEGPHDGCMCSSHPLSAGEDCPSYTYNQVGTERYGPNGESARLSFEIEVTCCDGSTSGETVVIDLGPEPGDREWAAEIEEIDADLEQFAQELAEECPGPLDVA